MDSDSYENFDAIIIGVGQAGKPLALALAEKDQRVAIIERYLVGGSCINYGCTPTKTLVASAKAAYEARRAADYGITTGQVKVDYKAVVKRKDKVVEQFREGVQQSLEEAKHVTLIRGEASFTDRKKIKVSLNDGGTRFVSAEQIFINTGTRARKPDLEGLDSIPWLTSTSLLNLTELPKHLIILGGGYIGLEFGQMFRRFGSKVTIIERGDQLVSREDNDIAEAMADILEEEKITIHLNSEAVQVSLTASEQVQLSIKKGKSTKKITGSHLLVAIGSTPNTEALNLEAAGIATDEKGYVKTNDRLQTSQSGIYALGDVKGGPAFTHISYDDFRIVEQNLLHNGKATTADRLVPYTVFTDPQLGRIGISEKEAREQGRKIKVACMPMSNAARALETSHTQGLMKVVIDAKTDQILGAAILGMEGGEIMSLLQVAMMGKLPYQRIRDGIFAHPTLAESLNNLFMQVK